PAPRGANKRTENGAGAAIGAKTVNAPDLWSNYVGTRLGRTMIVAEREGFEPPIRVPVCRISSAGHSTTLPPLRKGWAGQPGRPRVFSEGSGGSQGRR